MRAEHTESFPRLGEGLSSSLARAITILELMAAERRPLGVAEIAERLGWARTTAHRQLRALASLGFLEQDAQRKYRLSVRVTELGMSAWNTIGPAEHAAAEMARLARQSGMAVELAVLDGPEALVLARVEARRRRRVPGTLPSRRRPAHCTAAGKLLLAHLPAAAQRSLIGKGALPAHAPRTITDRRTLREQLVRVRSEGIAAADDELASGTSSIAAPVHEPDTPAGAALSLIADGYGSDSDGLREQHGEALMEAARAISVRLGWRLSGPRFL